MLATLSAVRRTASSPQLVQLAKTTLTQNKSVLRTVVASRRFQSSSSWSNNNNNNNSHHDIASMVNSESMVANTLGGLHRVDLAHGSFFALHRPLLGITNGPMFAQNSFEEVEDSADELAAYFSTLCPFTPPAAVGSASTQASVTVMSAPEAEMAVQDFFQQIDGKLREQKSIVDPLMDEANTMYMTSVLRKRKIKMRKHKYKKLRKRTRALRKKLGK
ncbi:hypothetical protein BGZ94_010220 [Podila epigama]|nr:hypothetical protein BGZ94_010220 [Podila epigama]